jgi:DNA polymerase elongation subunit (family B)
VVSYIGRKLLIEAKEIAEDHGFTVIHAYVDSLFISRNNASKEEDFQPLLDEIEQKTSLPIELEEIYSWAAFGSSKQNPNLSVPNRFFCLKSDGDYKLRGLASRREDTPPFIADTQLEILQLLAKEKDPNQLAKVLPEVLSMLHERITGLSHGSVPVEQLLITQRLSREISEYRVLSPAARAAYQLQTTGKNIQMGQKIQFVYVKTSQGVRAWSLPDPFDPAWLDIPKYKELLFSAVYEILQPIGVSKHVLRNWMFSKANYLVPPAVLHHRLELPLFATLKNARVDLM